MTKKSPQIHMMNLKQSLTRLLHRLPSSLVIAILIIALVGFADATYLSVEHFMGVIPPCSITGGCEKVLTSLYAVCLGIPVSLVGSIYCLVITICSFVFLESKHVANLEKHNSEMLRISLFLTIP